MLGALNVPTTALVRYETILPLMKWPLMVIVPLAPTDDCASYGLIVTVSVAENAPLGEMGMERGKKKESGAVPWTPSATSAALASHPPADL